MPAIRRTKLVEIFWGVHRWVYQKSGGRIGSKLLGMSVLLLTATGRKTGQPRTTPLYYLRHEESFVVIASHAGEPRHPAWFLNLTAHPTATVQIGARKFIVSAREAAGEERTRLWSQAVKADAGYAEYQERVEREIPVVVLEPVDAS